MLSELNYNYMSTNAWKISDSKLVLKKGSRSLKLDHLDIH